MILIKQLLIGLQMNSIKVMELIYAKIQWHYNA